MIDILALILTVSRILIFLITLYSHNKRKLKYVANNMTDNNSKKSISRKSSFTAKRRAFIVDEEQDHEQYSREDEPKHIEEEIEPDKETIEEDENIDQSSELNTLQNATALLNNIEECFGNKIDTLNVNNYVQKKNIFKKSKGINIKI